MRTWETTTTRHGTHSGAVFHRSLGEQPCDACYRAEAEYGARLKATPKRQQSARLRASAQNRAYKLLAARFPDEYHALYEAECAELGLSVRPSLRTLSA